MVDTSHTAQSVGLSFVLVGRRVAVGAGALIALVSLLADTPVWVASARGAVTALAVLLVVRLALAGMQPGPDAAETEPDA